MGRFAGTYAIPDIRHLVDVPLTFKSSIVNECLSRKILMSGSAGIRFPRTLQAGRIDSVAYR